MAAATSIRRCASTPLWRRQLLADAPRQPGWLVDQWMPERSPAMATDNSGAVHLAWPTVANETGVIFYATSRDGHSFSKPVRVPTFGTPTASHPQIAIDERGLVAAWTSRPPAQTVITVRRIR